MISELQAIILGQLALAADPLHVAVWLLMITGDCIHDLIEARVRRLAISKD